VSDACRDASDIPARLRAGGPRREDACRATRQACLLHPPRACSRGAAKGRVPLSPLNPLTLNSYRLTPHNRMLERMTCQCVTTCYSRVLGRVCQGALAANPPDLRHPQQRGACGGGGGWAGGAGASMAGGADAVLVDTAGIHKQNHRQMSLARVPKPREPTPRLADEQVIANELSETHTTRARPTRTVGARQSWFGGGGGHTRLHAPSVHAS
jgi:hypothetical protein